MEEIPPSTGGLGQVQLHFALQQSFTFRADHLAVILEYSLPVGCDCWGHYWVVVLTDESCCEFSSEFDEAIKTLEAVTGQTIVSQLSNADAMASNVVWPRHIQGARAVSFREAESSVLDRMRRILTGPRLDLYFSDVIIAEAERRKRAKGFMSKLDQGT